MAPKRKGSDSAKSGVKRTKVAMSLAEKVNVLDKLSEGLWFAAVGRLFQKNESTIRTIKKQEVEIRRSAITDSASKVTHQVRDKIFVKMENGLYIWLCDNLK